MAPGSPACGIFVPAAKLRLYNTVPAQVNPRKWGILGLRELTRGLGWPAPSLASLQLVKEIQQESQMRGRLLPLIAGIRHKSRHPLAVRRQVPRRQGAIIHHPCFRPLAGLTGNEGVAL